MKNYTYNTFTVDGQKFSVTNYEDEMKVYIKSIHPYDDADYHWALNRNGGDFYVIYIGSPGKKVDTVFGSKEKVARKLLELDKNIESRMSYESNLLKRVEKLLNENNKGYSQLDKQILEDLQNKGFKKFILRYTRIYDKIFEGRDEDGYPDFSYEFSDTDWGYAKVKETENKYEFGFELEDNRIFISENEDDDSGEYPSGGTPDHITYSNYDVELRNRYYLVNDYNEELKMSVKDYILENYPDTYVASLLLSDKVNFDNENIIDDLEYEDF